MVKDMHTIVNFCKSRGFMYQGSEIYGGIANVWDFGPYEDVPKFILTIL